MASASLHQIVGPSVSSRAPVASCKVDWTRSSSSFSSSVRLKPWWQLACQPLRSSVSSAGSAAPSLVSGKGRLNVFCQAVSTPEAGTEVGTDAESDVAALEVAAAEAREEEQPVVENKRQRMHLKHVMQTLNREAVEAATKDKNYPDIKPGDIVQLRVEVLENKKRVSLLRGIVIAKHNAGINTTFRIRRVLAGVGVEIVFPLYSPNIKEIKVIDHRKVRRAKLFYLRDKIARLSTC